MQRKYIILIHITFWVVMLFFIGLETIPEFGKVTYNIIAADYVLYVISFLTVFYLIYFYIKKEHLNKKRIRALIVFGLLFVFVISVPIALIYICFLAKDVFELNGNVFLIELSKYYLSFLETNFLFAMSGALLKIALLRYEAVMKQKEIEKQFVKGELALLRSQINPQFLFNTLTNIKSLIEILPDKAIYSIENLSEIMSYMLYETSADNVLLDNEINHINNYLNLQRVRYNPGFIDFKIIGKTAGISVPPLIFMPFIENAFKCGDGFSHTPGIIINLDVGDNNLSFEVMNHIKENAGQANSEDGFNMKSTKRRLDLLLGNNYSLEIKNENNKYIIKLNINLAE
jgi:two-component system, LytTR family, sensor kinase